jgi:plasmid stability protein
MDENSRLNLQLPKELKKELKVHSALSDKSMQEIVIESLKEYLTKEKKRVK